MRSPEEALSAARRRAAEQAPASGVAGPGPDDTPITETQPDSLKRLAAWAMIEPDETEVYSTRALGAPVTMVKRLLIRLLRQYFVQVTAQQSRFNAHLVAHLIALEERVARLERTAPEAAPAQAEAPRSDAGADGPDR